MMNALIFRDHVNIGKCSHAICVCAAHFHDPEGCVNFTPTVPQQAESASTLPNKVVVVIDEWLNKYASGIPFIDRAELVSKVTQVIEPVKPLSLIDRLMEAVDDTLRHFRWPAIDQQTRDGMVRRFVRALKEDTDGR